MTDSFITKSYQNCCYKFQIIFFLKGKVLLIIIINRTLPFQKKRCEMTCLCKDPILISIITTSLQCRPTWPASHLKPSFLIWISSTFEGCFMTLTKYILLSNLYILKTKWMTIRYNYWSLIMNAQKHSMYKSLLQHFVVPYLTC